MIRSDFLIFFFYRNFFLILSLGLIIVVISNVGLEEFNLEILLALIISITLLLIGHFSVIRIIKRATLTKETIRVGEVEILWSEVKEVKVNFLGFYKLVTKNQASFYFPGSDINIMLLGMRLNTDEMDEFIEKMSRKYGFKYE